MVRDPDMANIGSMDWDLITASGGRANCSQQAVPFHPPVPSSISVHKAQTVECLFLSYLSIAYLLTVVVLAEPPGCTPE